MVDESVTFPEMLVPEESEKLMLDVVELALTATRAAWNQSVVSL